MVGRRGKKKSLLAIGHKILCAAYHVIKNKASFEELGAAHLIERKRKNKIAYLKRQLKELGFEIQLKEKAA